MKIMKPGKVRLVKLDCPYCGCEFVCDPLTEIKAERIAEYKNDHEILYFEKYVVCPFCGNKFSDDFDGLPEYEEPTQSDEALLADLIHSSRAVDFDTAIKLSPWLIANGVTFREG